MATTNIVLATSGAVTNALAVEDARLFEEIIDAWLRRRVGSLRHTEKSVTRDIAVVRDFVAFTTLPPWLWDEPVFDDWCDHIGLERNDGFNVRV